MPIKTDPQLSPAALATWRLLRDEGGYWTPCEVGAAVFPDVPPHTAVLRAAPILRSLARGGYVCRHPRLVCINAYGVRANCFVPEGETLDPSATTGSAT